MEILCDIIVSNSKLIERENAYLDTSLEDLCINNMLVN